MSVVDTVVCIEPRWQGLGGDAQQPSCNQKIQNSLRPILVFLSRRNSQKLQMAVTADYNLDIDYVGSEPENEPDVQEEKEENSDAEYTKVKIPCDGTFHQRMMHWNVFQRIQHIH